MHNRQLIVVNHDQVAILDRPYTFDWWICSSSDYRHQVLCRRSDVLWSLEDDATADASSESHVRQALGRAPRPVLHLLRSEDLAKVDAGQSEEVHQHNEAQQNLSFKS